MVGISRMNEEDAHKFDVERKGRIGWSNGTIWIGSAWGDEILEQSDCAGVCRM